MKSKLLLVVSAASIVLSNITIAWSNSTEPLDTTTPPPNVLPTPPSTTDNLPVNNPTDTNINNTNTEVSNKATFSCEAKGDLLLTVAKAEGKEDIAIFDWNEKHFSDRVQAAEICEKAATKLQTYYDNSKLNNISFASGKVNEKPLLCIQEVKEGETLNGRSSNCTEADEVLVPLDSSQKAGRVLCDVIVDDRQKPSSCKITQRGDFPMRFRFNWFPF
jgi:hypothetical protein